MSAVLTSPEDIVNNALSRIGFKQRIGSMYEGSAAAKVALDIYGQTRDDLLREGDWGFASEQVTLTLLKSEPAGGYAGITWTRALYPPLGWKYEYAYPSNCLKVRSLRGTPLFQPEYDPQPVLFDTPNDSAYTASVKTIVTNLSAPAQATITLQVTNPANWEPTFVEAMIATLARKLAPTLSTMQAEQAEAAEERATTEIATVTQG